MPSHITSLQMNIFLIPLCVPVHMHTLHFTGENTTERVNEKREDKVTTACEQETSGYVGGEEYVPGRTSMLVPKDMYTGKNMLVAEGWSSKEWWQGLSEH